MIDLHCHLLPGTDDGPETMEDTLELARAAVAAGTTTIVATPHVSWDYQANTAVSIAAGVAELTGALHGAQIALTVLPGAEVALTRAVDLSDHELMALRLGGASGTYLLVECPLSPGAAGLEGLLSSLRDRGHDLLLAHPERCPAFQRDPEAYARLIASGMYGQVTAGALVGRFGRAVQSYAGQLVRDGLVHVAASDAHSARVRPPTLLPELREAGFGEVARRLTGGAPQAILDGRRLPTPPATLPTARRTLGQRLRGR